MSQLSSFLCVGELKLDQQTGEVWRQDRILKLNPIQYKILNVLAERSPDVVTRRELEKAVWEHNIPASDALRTHIYRLRNILDKPFTSPLIHTMHGRGFQLAAYG